MDQSDLPPEILARAFEFGIHAWGIQFLRPLSRVCRYWQEIVETTPRLWGIFIIKKASSTKSLELQIAKAKASPLSISLPGGTRKWNKPVVDRLISLSYNWIHADMTTTTFARCRWADLCTNLEELHLSRGRLIDDDPRDFFGDTSNFQLHSEIKLRSFTAVHLPKSWVLGFLGPSIKHFRLIRGHHEEQHNRYNIFHTVQYLSRLNGAVVIELVDLYHSNPGLRTPDVIYFNNLQTLLFSNVLYPSIILSSISAPSLQMLTIDCTRQSLRFFDRNNDILSMSAFFSQWSQPGFVPVNLHTLELVSCLKVTDIPYLIRWLAHLPNIVRLILNEDAIGRAATSLGQDTDQANLYKVLASPLSSAFTVNGWLCPSLMILHLETDQVVADLIPIARARGGIASPDLGIPPPSRLRRIEAVLCSSSEPGERELLDSLVDHAECICISCGLALELVV